MQLTSIIAAISCGLLLSGIKLNFNYLNFGLVEFKKWEIGEIFLLSSIMYFITFSVLLFIKYKSKSHRQVEKHIFNSIIRFVFLLI